MNEVEATHKPTSWAGTEALGQLPDRELEAVNGGGSTFLETMLEKVGLNEFRKIVRYQ